MPKRELLIPNEERRAGDHLLDSYVQFGDFDAQTAVTTLIQAPLQCKGMPSNIPPKSIRNTSVTRRVVYE